MELIRISDRKLKIMLTPTDMCHFDLNTESLGEDSARMHRAFRQLLEEVREQSGFEADESHLSIRYFPSREGGCEMFICNLQGDERERLPISTSAPHPTKRPSSGLHPIGRDTGGFRKECAYRFEALCHLLKSCQRLFHMHYACESAAYKDDHGAYFLILSVRSLSPFSTPEELDFIVEYGTVENAAHLRLYIREHASLICTGAIEQLAALA